MVRIFSAVAPKNPQKSPPSRPTSSNLKKNPYRSRRIFLVFQNLKKILIVLVGFPQISAQFTDSGTPVGGFRFRLCIATP